MATLNKKLQLLTIEHGVRVEDDETPLILLEARHSQR
jgi:hypothetical protein